MIDLLLYLFFFFQQVWPSAEFFLLAAVCNSIMDTLTHHFDKSIFQHNNRQWWDPSISWTNKYKDGIVSHGHKKWKIWKFEIDSWDWCSDAWHVFKTSMIHFICLGFAFLTDFPVTAYFFFGGIWLAGFNLPYNHILKRTQ